MNMDGLKLLLGKINRFNDELAIKITNGVGTMWCAYAFAALALISLPDAIHGGVATLIAWIAQTFLQLVLLSIIMVGQSVSSKANEAAAIKAEQRAQQDHEAIMTEVSEIKEMHDDMKTLLSEVAKVVVPQGS